MSSRMTDDPWAGLGRPGRGRIEARRVDRERRHDFFWARHPDGRVGLSLFHASSFPDDLKLPRMRGLELRRHEPSEGARGLHWILGDPSAQEPFAELCRDVVSAAGDEESEASAIRTAVNRTWRWHRLLRAGGRGPLTPEEQKGLIAELLILELLLNRDLLVGGIEAWRGPLADAKDFRVGGVGIEVKAPRGREGDHIQIPSEHQLDGSGIRALFLAVVPVVRPTEACPDSITIRHMVERVSQVVDECLPHEVGLLGGLLLASGFDWDHDYSEHRWDVGEPRVYQVRQDFPALTRNALPSGVHTVSYRISLASIEMWSVPLDTLFESLDQEE